MNKYIVNPSSQFEIELKEIYRTITFYSKESKIAQKAYSKIINTIYSLNFFPERYAKIIDYSNEIKKIRKLPIKNYIVIYEVDIDTRTSIYFTYI